MLIIKQRHSTRMVLSANLFSTRLLAHRTLTLHCVPPAVPTLKSSFMYDLRPIICVSEVAHTSVQINDYNIDGRGAKSTGMSNLIKRLKKDKVPIDGIGLQAHLIVGQLPTDIKENIQDFVNLGVEVAITELDIRMPTPPTQANLEQQKKDYETVIKACKAVKKCIGVTIWDWTDKVCIFRHLPYII